MIWWQLGDMSPDIRQRSGTMLKLVCRSSKLKSDSYLYRNDGDNCPYCDTCQEFALEDTWLSIALISKILGSTCF